MEHFNKKKVLNTNVQFKTFSFFVIHKHTVKHMITLCIPKLLKKIFYLFSLHCIRMSGKNINFDDKNILKSDFYKEQKSKKHR